MKVLKEVITTYIEEDGKIKITETPLVRCKECKWCDNGIDEDGKPFLKCLGIHYGGTKAEDFCSYGERRTDE